MHCQSNYTCNMRMCLFFAFIFDHFVLLYGIVDWLVGSGVLIMGEGGGDLFLDGLFGVGTGFLILGWVGGGKG